LALLVYIDLGDQYIVLGLACDEIQVGRHRFTRPTPRSPEVDENHTVVGYGFVEGLVG